MSFQNRNISPYKDVRISTHQAREIDFDDILSDDISCELRFENGAKQEARGRAFAKGDYRCSTLRQGLQFISCDLVWKLGANTVAIWPAGFQMSALSAGTSSMMVEGKTYVHPTDRVVQVAGLGQETEVCSLGQSNEPTRMAGLLITPEFFNDLDSELAKGFAPLRKLLEPGARRFVLSKATSISAMVQRMQDMPYQGAMGDLYLESMATAALIELADQMSSDTLNIVAGTEKSKYRLAAEARAQIDERPDTIASARDLAHELGTNETTLRLQFKEVYGISLMSHVRDVRLMKARQKIRAGDRQISQVAYDCGYTHPANFTHAYRKRFGCTPRADSPHFKC